MAIERTTLREADGIWEEDWGGFKEFQFPATETQALRIDFDKPFIAIDELEVFGLGDFKKNLALAEDWTKLVSDETMIQIRGELVKANDGEYGTNGWKARAPPEAKTSLGSRFISLLHKK